MVRNNFTPDRRGILRLIAGGTVGATLPVAFETPAFAAGKRVGLVVKNLGNSYFDACADGAMEAAKQIGGIEIIYTAPTKPTAEDQIAVIDGLIAQKVDGIMVSANDANALVPVGKKAAQRGIKVISFNSAIAKGGRIMHLNASSTALIGAKQVQMIAKTLKDEGEVAILSAASTMTNQNSWIEAMKEEWKKPEYAKMKLVATVYGDDQDDKSYREMQALVKAHPEPERRNLADHDRHPGWRQGHHGWRPGRQGLHHRPRPAVRNEGRGAEGRLRQPSRSGTRSTTAMLRRRSWAISSAGASAEPGSTLKMGRMGETKVGDDGEAAMGEPFTFDKSNVEKYAKIF